VLAAGVTLAAGASVTDSVLWDGTELGREARVEGALLGHRVRVGARARVAPGAVLGDGTVISDFTRTA
jgi:NDP-sugar pyrophosphorylase family protein